MDPDREKMYAAILDMFEGDDFKDSFLKELNEEVDIPMISEKKEGKIFKALYKVLFKTLRNTLEKKDD
jgi:hypothetical protein|tara:strand:- start:379 stop:582 length:204 start_codon:yes stop_codon:yes gene_type:complete